MPTAPRRPCVAPGCASLALPGESRCAVHLEQARERQRQADASRGSAYQRGYDKRWQRARYVFLAEHPMCAACLERGHYTPATVVDHIIPHKGDKRLFWDDGNWQALCKACHDRKTATEDGGYGNPRGKG